MMSFDDWVRQQNAIYADFERQAILAIREGSKPNSNILSGEGGYIIALQHSISISKIVAVISDRLNKTIPSVVYGDMHIHTTLATFGQSNSFAIQPAILDKLSKAIKVVARNGHHPMINFDKWLMNQESVIAAGAPNADFYNLFTDVLTALKNIEIEAKMPKMAHITASRFAQTCSNSTMEEVWKVLQTNQVPGFSDDLTIVSGYFLTTPQAFNLRVDARTKLNG